MTTAIGEPEIRAQPKKTWDLALWLEQLQGTRGHQPSHRGRSGGRDTARFELTMTTTTTTQCATVLAVLVATIATARSNKSPPALSFRSRHRSLHALPRQTSVYSNANSVLGLRAGGFDDYSDDEYDYDEFDDSDFDFDDDGMFDFDAAEDDFGDENTLTQLKEAYAKTPPLTKAYLTASFGAAALGYLTNKNEFLPILQLSWKPTLTRLQLWRPLTAFLNFGSLGLGYLLTIQFVWTYASTLERLNHNTPYDFWLMMFFGAAMMVTGYSIMGLNPHVLGHNLSTYLVYIWSRYHEGLEVNMFELFNTRAEMLPWFFLAQVSLIRLGAAVQ